jgi:hypothetical protein
MCNVALAFQYFVGVDFWLVLLLLINLYVFQILAASITYSVKNVTCQMKWSCCFPELLAYEIHNNLGEIHPVKQQMFEITSKIILIRLLVQYHGNWPQFAMENCICHEEQHKMHVPTFGKLFVYNE